VDRETRAVPYLSFWPPTTTQDNVLTKFSLVRMEDLITLARRHGEIYRQATFGNLEIGIVRRPRDEDRQVWSVTHFMPIAFTHKLPKRCLGAVGELFDKLPGQ
jgi:hypothetical protein